MNKIARQQSAEHVEEPLELENHFILRLPENAARDVRDWLQSGGAQFKDKLQINFNPDMRHAQVKVDKTIFQGTLMDLPCIVETLKTVDKKNFYKVADLSQILICKEGGDEFPKEPKLEQQQPQSHANSNDNQNKKKDKQFQYPHGITPPLKNVRKRRFRKTLKKKYMDAPELEKELKRLLRADLDAEKVRYEIVTPEQELQQKLAQKASGSFPSESNQQLDISLGSNPIREDDLFGAALSSSSEDDDDDVAEGRHLAQQLMMATPGGTDDLTMSPSADSMTDHSQDLETFRLKIVDLQSTLSRLESERIALETKPNSVENDSAKEQILQDIEDTKDEIDELKQVIRRN